MALMLTEFPNTKEKAMQVNVILTRQEIMDLAEKKLAESFPNLERVVRNYAEQVPEVINIQVVLKQPKEAPME
jgi:hypothetical protein